MKMQSRKLSALIIVMTVTSIVSQAQAQLGPIVGAVAGQVVKRSATRSICTWIAGTAATGFLFAAGMDGYQELKECLSSGNQTQSTLPISFTLTSPLMPAPNPSGLPAPTAPTTPAGN